MVKIWFWYLKPLLRNLKLNILTFQFLPHSIWKYFLKIIFIRCREGIEKTKCSILNFSKSVWDINTKFSPVVVLISFQLSTKFGVPSLTKKWISCQNYFKLQEGVAGVIFEPHPWNSGNLLLFLRCTNHITIIFWKFQ